MKKRIWRALIACALAAAFVLGAALVLAPGAVRLVILQPLRDVLFFQRELAPLDDFENLEKVNPTPTESIILPAQRGTAEIALDVWVPADTPAPVVLLLHGSSPRGRHLGMNRVLASRLQRQGWLVLTPDARGFGDSADPEDWRNPGAWLVSEDLARLADYARQRPESDGTLAGIGHSLGGSHLLQLDPSEAGLDAMVLMGPSRHESGHRASWSERVRYAADRGYWRIMPQQVVDADFARTEILDFARRYRDTEETAVLLMDGEREGQDLISVLDEAAAIGGDAFTHKTVQGSHHYCGAYQLPWPFEAIYLRRSVFESCFRVISSFLQQHTASALPTR